MDLIIQLFEDPSIEARNDQAAGNYPDINSVADSIAKIHEIKLATVKHELLDKWLPIGLGLSLRFLKLKKLWI